MSRRARQAVPSRCSRSIWRTIDVEEMARICTIPGRADPQGHPGFLRGRLHRQHHRDRRPHPAATGRPASTTSAGVAAHKGGMNSCFAIHLLNLLVGAVDVPGGQRGVNPIGPYWSAGVPTTA